MIKLDMDQNSLAWFQARLGIPTASGFKNIVNHKGEKCKGRAKGSASEMTKTYMRKLAWERLIGEPLDTQVESPAMARGTELEPHALAWYQFKTGEKVEATGFVYMDETRRFGASPDGLLVDKPKGIEIKCLETNATLKSLTELCVPDEYIVQVQGGMWVCGFDSWDYVTYTNHPVLGQFSFIQTVEKDERIHKALDEFVPEFCGNLDKLEKDLRERYPIETPKYEAPPACDGEDFIDFASQGSRA